MPSGISKNPLNDISQVYLDSISEGRLASLEKASVLAASDDPKDQDKAREIKTRFDYESLKKQIGSKKKHSKPVVGEGLSDWRDDLREITGGASPMLSSNPVVGSEPSTNIHGTDDQTGRKVVEKKIKNKIKINPTFKEAAEEIAENLGGKLLEVAEVMDDKKDEEDPGLKSKQQKARMIKKQVLMKKLQAVRQGSEDIVAHYEPEGEEVDEACWKGYKAYGMKKKGGKMVPNCKPVGSVKEASAVLDANKKLETERKTKKDKAELAKLTHIYKGMKKGIYNSYEPEGEPIGERTLSSYIPSDRQGEARRANLDYTKAQLKKKEDQSTKNRGDLSKRDAGKMAKERLHTKKIMSMGEAKVDKGRSDYGKASIRNYRRSGPGHGEPAMFDPENKRGKTIDKRREEHKERRGVKKAKVPAYKVDESMGGGVPLTPPELEIQKKMSRLNVRLARKRSQEMQKAKVQDTETAPEQVKEAKSAAWQRKEGKRESGGLNQKGVDSYRRDNPGSKSVSYTHLTLPTTPYV